MAFLDVKGQLARLLATENLIVEHDGTIDTASFNTATRVLKLPLLMADNEHVYNMMIGHEVGHALQTPVDWAEIIPDDVPFDFVNVVEDVRIEKHIQDKFPGLRKDFSKGYDQLNDKDFFDIEGKDLDKLNFIDRINLHFKLGARALIPFTEEEMTYVRAVDESDTFQKVCLTAKMIAEFVKAQGKKKDQETEELTTDVGQGEGVESEDNRPEGQIKNDEKDEGRPDQVREQSDEMKSETQESFDKAMRKLVDKSEHNQTMYCHVPKDEYLDIIVPASHVELSINENDVIHDFHAICQTEYKEFLASIKAEVNYMVQQFEMKKSAQAYARAQTHRTGVLDMERLPQYKLVDDIFKKQTTLPDGKNHGMVMLLDWSGSMDDIVFNTVKQILVLTQFCRKVQIPFEVMTFNYTNYRQCPDMAEGEVNAHSLNIVQRLSSSLKKKDLEQQMFNLYCDGRYHNNRYALHPHTNFASLGGTPLNNVMTLMPAFLRRFMKQTGAEKVSFVCVTDGESSPLFMNAGLRGFGGLRQGGWTDIFLRDGAKTIFLGRYESEKHTGILARWVEDSVPGVTTTNIFMGSPRTVERYAGFQGAGASGTGEFRPDLFRKTGQFVCTTKHGWGTVACVNPKQFNNDMEEIPCEAGATKAQLRSALKKYFKSKKTNKIFLSGLVNQLA